jgi:hypothetical protein
LISTTPYDGPFRRDLFHRDDGSSVVVVDSIICAITRAGFDDHVWQQ